MLRKSAVARIVVQALIHHGLINHKAPHSLNEERKRKNNCRLRNFI